MIVYLKCLCNTLICYAATIHVSKAEYLSFLGEVNEHILSKAGKSLQSKKHSYISLVLEMDEVQL